MEFEKYNNEINLNLDEKRIESLNHKLTVKEDSIKDFYSSKEEEKILEEIGDYPFLLELSSYEKELCFGEFRN